MKENHPKSDFRISCIKRLKFIEKFAKYKKDKVIVERLFDVIKEENARSVLVYIPLKMEVNVMPLINRLRRSGFNVFVPYMHHDSFKIVKYRLPLKKKKFGISEPKNSFFKAKVDLAIVPIVGVDNELKRIGFGAGMYDRFFHRINYEPVIVFTQREFCKSSKKLSDKYDIQANYIVTF